MHPPHLQPQPQPLITMIHRTITHNDYKIYHTLKMHLEASVNVMGKLYSIFPEVVDVLILKLCAITFLLELDSEDF
jgi:hypothetical protein